MHYIQSFTAALLSTCQSLLPILVSRYTHPSALPFSFSPPIRPPLVSLPFQFLCPTHYICVNLNVGSTYEGKHEIFIFQGLTYFAYFHSFPVNVIISPPLQLRKDSVVYMCIFFIIHPLLNLWASSISWLLCIVCPDHGCTRFPVVG